MEREYITESERRVPVTLRADVIVIGGGPAGFGAALRAAQGGAETILIERFGNLGGTNTTGYMYVTYDVEHLAAEVFEAMTPGGHVADLLDRYPDLTSNPLVHYSKSMDKQSSRSLIAWDPDICAFTFMEMLEKAKVRCILDTQFTDVILDAGRITAVVVENASGRQAIAGRAFIDATGRGDVMARAGCPFVSASNEQGIPTPAGLMWRVGGVDIDRLFDHQRSDPNLDRPVEKAKRAGELPPYYTPKKTEQDMALYDSIYTGHPRPEFCPTLRPGELLMWAPAPYDLRLNPAENAADLITAELSIRKLIFSELKFLTNYVPGFADAYVSGVAPLMGIREGRHAVGEYVMTLEDIATQRSFPDTAIKLKTQDALVLREKEREGVEFEVPFRCFLPRKVDNLLLAGDHISAEHGAFLHMRGFGKAMGFGEVAGTAAALSLPYESAPKTLDYAELRRALAKHGLL